MYSSRSEDNLFTACNVYSSYIGPGNRLYPHTTCIVLAFTLVHLFQNDFYDLMAQKQVIIWAVSDRIVVTGPGIRACLCLWILRAWKPGNTKCRAARCFFLYWNTKISPSTSKDLFELSVIGPMQCLLA